VISVSVHQSAGEGGGDLSFEAEGEGVGLEVAWIWGVSGISMDGFDGAG